jgi:2-hydroxy-3-keto-5-methylthiopentenyl-1-phosphate phosphatase
VFALAKTVHGSDRAATVISWEGNWRIKKQNNNSVHNFLMENDLQLNESVKSKELNTRNVLAQGLTDIHPSLQSTHAKLVTGIDQGHTKHM